MSGARFPVRRSTLAGIALASLLATLFLALAVAHGNAPFWFETPPSGR